MQLVEVDHIELNEEPHVHTDNQSELFISSTQQPAPKRAILSEYERLMMAKRKKNDLQQKRNKLLRELHRAEVETKNMLRQGYFKKLKLQKKQHVMKTKEQRKLQISQSQNAQHEQLMQKTMKIRNMKERNECLLSELDKSQRDRLISMRTTFLRDKHQLRQQKEMRQNLDLQNRKRMFSQQKSRQFTSQQRRQAFKDIKEGIAKQNYVLRIKRELEELGHYSALLQQLGGVQREAYECMKQSSQLSKRTQSELRQVLNPASHPFLTTH